MAEYGSSCPKDLVAGEETEHEGESTVAKRLIGNMVDMYGSGFLDTLT